MKTVFALIVALLLVGGVEEEPLVKLGEPVRLGGIELTALSVELREISIKQPGWPGARVIDSAEKYTVLTYKVANVTDVQVIHPGRVPGKIEDQFGNVHKQISGGDICEGCVIVEPNRPVELLPGDSQVLIVVFEAPKIKKAELFTATLTVVIDNRGTKAEAGILFERKQLDKSD